jgi:taurine--2-oxoglutarate transaminase
MIADEVMAGWGRTGKWFSVDHWGVTPDILVTAKGITSAYVPLGLCATSKKDCRLLRGSLLLARAHV